MMENRGDQNNLDWDTLKKSINKSLLKKPEVLAGFALFAVIISYLILSPSENTDPSSLTVDKSVEQLTKLPIPEIKNEELIAQANIPEEDILEVPAIDSKETTSSDEENTVSPTASMAFAAHDVLTNPPSDLVDNDTPPPAETVHTNKIVEKPKTTTVSKKEPEITAPKIAKTDKRKAVESWVFAKDPNLYTIQLIGSSNKKEIENFIKSNQKQSNLSYFNTINKNKNWYVVVQGSYNNFGEAESKRKSLPANLAKYGAWVRKYSSIQKEITANAEKIMLMNNAFATNE